MYIFVGIYLVSLLITFIMTIRLYQEMEWNKYDMRRPGEFNGDLVHDMLFILFWSATPLMNTVNALERIYRRKKDKNMIMVCKALREEEKKSFIYETYMK